MSRETVKPQPVYDRTDVIQYGMLESANKTAPEGAANTNQGLATATRKEPR